VSDPDNPEDILSKNVQDHDFDAARYMLMIKKPVVVKKEKKQIRRDLPKADPLNMEPRLGRIIA
jgi:hypothetical protein